MNASTSHTPRNGGAGLVAGAHQAVDKIAEAACQAAERIQLKKAGLKKAGVELAGDCKGYVNENPLLSLGVAAAVGFLVRHLIHPRH